MSGVAHVRLRNVSSGALWETSFRGLQKLEQLEVERQVLEFLYADDDFSYFMHPATFEQRAISNIVIGPPRVFLESGVQATVELVEGEPVALVIPEIQEGRVAETPAPAHGAQDSTWKTARLENGLEILVPQFIKGGDRVRVDINDTGYSKTIESFCTGSKPAQVCFSPLT